MPIFFYHESNFSKPIKIIPSNISVPSELSYLKKEFIMVIISQY